MSADSTVRPVSLANAALQLALCYKIGFGTDVDEHRVALVLKDHSLDPDRLQHCVQSIDDNYEELSAVNDLFSLLNSLGSIQFIDFPQYYRERQLLEKAEASYRQEMEIVRLTFGENHFLYFILVSRLIGILQDQGRWKEAGEFGLKIVATREGVLGLEHPHVLGSIQSLALTYMNQGRLKEAEQLEIRVLEMRKKLLGLRHLDTLISMSSLA